MYHYALQNIYGFYNDIKIFISGSSSININRAKYDLSRRCVTYILHGLSFREFFNLFDSKSDTDKTLIIMKYYEKTKSYYFFKPKLP